MDSPYLYLYDVFAVYSALFGWSWRGIYPVVYSRSMRKRDLDQDLGGDDGIIT